MEFSHIDSRYKYLFFISQAETERVIREQLARQGVEIERPVEMIALAQEASAHLAAAESPRRFATKTAP